MQERKFLKSLYLTIFLITDNFLRQDPDRIPNNGSGFSNSNETYLSLSEF
jgi:hypothetical protein